MAIGEGGLSSSGVANDSGELRDRNKDNSGRAALCSSERPQQLRQTPSVFQPFRAVVVVWVVVSVRAMGQIYPNDGIRTTFFLVESTNQGNHGGA
ncbi:unnamed protein product [Cuscuta campestris]|uniref:Uncharacterized protein n=1 Tax=Cuscuta campestris TaxID=132261 RepID=A0A484N8H1_9ASTE|nr:unnamed protein product [Cuscuta campestris]